MQNSVSGPTSPVSGAIDSASGRIATDPAFDLPAYTRQLATTVERAVAPAADG